MDTNSDFFKKNECQLSKDAEHTPPLYYQSLDDAFINYFQTVKNIKNSYHLLLDFKMWKHDTLSFDFYNSDCIVQTILSFHRFFELLLKDILNRINPFLAVKFPRKEKDAIKYCNNEAEAERMESVEFNSAYERFKEAVRYYDKNLHKTQYAVANQFRFLIDDSLDYLARWRNRIMHNGKTIPNILLFDYLVSQKLIPLVVKVFENDKTILNGFKPHYFETFTGIKIIDGINTIKFDTDDFYDDAKIDELRVKLLKLAHLKELGRAAYGLDLTLKNNILYHEPYYENPIGRFIRYAECETKYKYYHAIKKCPCCGHETLVIYKKEYDDIIFKKKESFSWFRCTTCSYSLKDNLGDPALFGFCKERLFDCPPQ
ncbi:MAG TPA: hypothetical protein PKW80_00175 [Bacteroidales bacterium]|nr:hypothetical protein [Bacteroidales bacterium]